MKRTEQVLAGLCVLLFIGAFFVGPLRGLVALDCWVLALFYLIIGHRLFRVQGASLLLPWAAALAFAAAFAALPMALAINKALVFQLLPLPCIVLSLFLLVRALVVRRARARGQARPLRTGLLVRSVVLAAGVGVLSYIPPIAPYRAFMIAYHHGQDRLVANMEMVGESVAYREARDRGDHAAALEHALKANAAGLHWLGADVPEERIGLSVQELRPFLDTLSDPAMHRALLEALDTVRAMQHVDLWPISGTFDNLYHAYRRCGSDAEDANDNAKAARFYALGDSALNAVPRGKDAWWAAQRPWSLNNRARSLAATGEVDVSDSLFSRALKLYEEVHDSLDAGCVPILCDWGHSVARRRHWRMATRMLRWADRLLLPDSADAEVRDLLLRDRVDEANYQLSMDSLPQAAASVRYCLAHTHPDSAMYCKVALLQGAYAYRADDLPQALDAFIRALSCVQARQAANPFAIAMAELGLGRTELALAHLDNAEAHLRHGLQVVDEKMERDDRMGALFMTSLAEVHRQQGDYGRAKAEYDMVMKRFPTDEGGDVLPGALIGAAQVAYDLAELQAGRAFAQRAWEEQGLELASLHPDGSMTLDAVAYGDYTLGRLDTAAQEYGAVLTMLQAYGNAQSGFAGSALNGAGLVALAQKHYDAADSLFAQALALHRRIFPGAHPGTARVLLNVALLRTRQRRYDDALVLLAEARGMTEQVLGASHDQVADILLALAEIQRAQGRATDAKANCAQAHTIYLQHFPPTHPKVVASARGM